MLTELLKLIENSQGPLDLDRLSQQLNAHPTAIAGMVEVLVRKGRLQEMAPSCGYCESCGSKNSCGLPAVRAKQYQVVSRRIPVSPRS